MSLTNILAQHGVTVAQAQAALAPLVATPEQLYAALNQYQLTTAMLAELAGVPESDARSYLAANGLDAAKLDAHGAAKTDYVFLSDLNDGDIFIYNTQTGEGREIYSFNQQITDIAVASNGDIYATDFNGLHRYEWATGQLTQVLEVGNLANSLVIEDNYIAVATAFNSRVDVYELGSFNSVLSLSSASAQRAGASQGDLAFVDGLLYRTSMAQGLVSVALNGETTVLASQLRSDYFGLTGTEDGHVLAFTGGGEVRSYSVADGTVTELPDIELMGLSTVSGAAEVLQMHLYGL